MTGQRYMSDSEIVADYSLGYASSVEIAGDGKDVWIFDVDETLLTNLPFYQVHGFGSETFDENAWDMWVDLAEASAIPASLKLYNELKQRGSKYLCLLEGVNIRGMPRERIFCLQGTPAGKGLS
ncbi:hypothetical protein REPUB_Repub03eG0073000 [Reevesia pubescens]